MKQTELLKEKIKVLEELVKFYGEILDGHAVYLHVHGINESEVNIQKGKDLRAQLASLTDQISKVEKEPLVVGKNYFAEDLDDFDPNEVEFSEPQRKTVCPKCESDNLFSVVQEHFKCKEKECNYRFTKDVDGFDGQPSGTVMSAEEVMIKHCTDNGLINLNMGKQIIAAMIDFASQQSGVTDKEIKLWAEEIEIKTEDELSGLEYLIMAAKAMRDGTIQNWLRDKGKG